MARARCDTPLVNKHTRCLRKYKVLEKGENLKEVKLAQIGDVKISPFQQSTASNRSEMTIGGVSYGGGSQELAKEVTRPILFIRLKMEDACILCNGTKI